MVLTPWVLSHPIHPEERRRTVFPVEIAIRERNEDALTARMTAMREWLDHHRFEPATFRYTYTGNGILFRIDFSIESEARAFANEFGGRAMPMIPAVDAALPGSETRIDGR